MPRPGDLRDWLHLDGGPDFRTGGWWDIFNEARVFYPRGFQSAMQVANIASARPIAEKLGAAQALLGNDTNWHRAYSSRHWTSTASSQASHIANGKPMLLSKIAICTQALQLAADELAREGSNAPTFDAFARVRVLPGVHALVGLDAYLTANRTESLRVAGEIEAAGIAEQGDRLLNDLAGRQHAPFAVASFIYEALHKPRAVRVALATRPGKTGVKPATEQLRYP